MDSESLGDERKFDETAVFFLASKDKQKLEVSYGSRSFLSRKYFQIVLDDVCLEPDVSEPEFEQGKTYPLPDNKILIIKFLGNNVVVWVDDQLIPLNHKESHYKVDPWEDVTLMMYFSGGLGILLGVWQLFPLSDIDFSSSSFWMNSVCLIFLGAILLICGYVGRCQQKAWTLWLGNGILLIFLFAWFYIVFYADWGNFRITHVFDVAIFAFLAVRQARNTRKAQASLNE